MTYGLMPQDVVIIAANGITVALAGASIFFKMRYEHRS